MNFKYNGCTISCDELVYRGFLIVPCSAPTTNWAAAEQPDSLPTQWVSVTFPGGFSRPAWVLSHPTDALAEINSLLA